MPTRSTLFVSYSHQDQDWFELLKTHLRPLKRSGTLEIWDDRKIRPGSNWREEIRKAIEACKVAVLLITPDFLASDFIAENELPPLLEAAQTDGVEIFPLLVSYSLFTDSPELSNLQAFNSPAEPLDTLPKSKQNRVLTDAARSITAAFLKKRPRPRSDVAPHMPLFDFDRLQRPATPNLVGRIDVLNRLDKFLYCTKTKVLGLIADGGVGKTALVYEWLNRLSCRQTDVERIFGWSFYDPESHTVSSTSEAFSKNVFRFFEDDGIALRTHDARACRIFDQLRRSSTILVLDGVEPLQYSNDVPDYKKGEFVDRLISALLRLVARDPDDWTGRMVLVTSRLPLRDVKGIPGYHEMPLKNLSDREGAALLSQLGVSGSEKRLRTASHDMQGYSLAIVLLGKLVSAQLRGNIEEAYNRSILGSQPDSLFGMSLPEYIQNQGLLEETEYGAHARRVMASYGEILAEASPERILLQIMSLFRRPVSAPEKNELIDHADIARSVKHLTHEQWKIVDQELERYGLLLGETRRGGGPRLQWDCHPLVREYFRELFREEKPGEWRNAHNILFRYFQNIPRKQFPDDLTQLLPLYRAVFHGCLSGLHKSALQLYQHRIMRNAEEAFSTNRLGASAQDVAILKCFLQPNDGVAGENLLPADCAWIRGRIAFCLMCLGRLSEAIEERKEELKYLQGALDWKGAAFSAGSLADLYIYVGDISGAIKYAKEAVEMANNSGDFIENIISKTKLASVYYHRGEFLKALRLFEEAEKIQIMEEPRKICLHSESGWRFNVLLLDQAVRDSAKACDQGLPSFNDILKRAESALDADERDSRMRWQLAIGLDRVVKGCALAGAGNAGAATWELDAGLERIQDSGSVIHLTYAYITRAAFRRYQKQRNFARQDLADAEKHIDECGMPLYRADVQLLSAQVDLDDIVDGGGDNYQLLATAKSAFEDARQTVTEYGYFLRVAELEMVESRLDYHRGYRELAKKHLENAWKELDEHRRWGLVPEWTSVKQEIKGIGGVRIRSPGIS